MVNQWMSLLRIPRNVGMDISFQNFPTFAALITIIEEHLQ